MTAVSAEDETQAQVTLSIDLGKPSLKKKSVTFFTLESDPPPYFPESVTKIQKQKIRPLKCNIKPF